MHVVCAACTLNRNYRACAHERAPPCERRGRRQRQVDCGAPVRRGLHFGVRPYHSLPLQPPVSAVSLPGSALAFPVFALPIDYMMSLSKNPPEKLRKYAPRMLQIAKQAHEAAVTPPSAATQAPRRAATRRAARTHSHIATYTYTHHRLAYRWKIQRLCSKRS